MKTFQSTINKLGWCISIAILVWGINIDNGECGIFGVGVWKEGYEACKYGNSSLPPVIQDIRGAMMQYASLDGIDVGAMNLAGEQVVEKECTRGVAKVEEAFKRAYVDTPVLLNIRQFLVGDEQDYIKRWTSIQVGPSQQFGSIKFGYTKRLILIQRFRNGTWGNGGESVLMAMIFKVDPFQFNDKASIIKYSIEILKFLHGLSVTDALIKEINNSYVNKKVEAKYVAPWEWWAYQRAAKEGVIAGNPINLVHKWNKVDIQDFRDGNSGEAAIIVNSQNSSAEVVYGNYWKAYKQADGSNALGAPTSTVQNSPNGGRTQTFQQGKIVKYADKKEMHVEFLNGKRKIYEIKDNGSLYEKKATQSSSSSGATIEKSSGNVSSSLIQSKENPSYCLHKQSDRFYNGNRIHLWKCNEGIDANKLWIYDSQSGYIMAAADRTYCLHKQYDPFYNGNVIHLWKCAEGPAKNKTWTYDSKTGYIKSRYDSSYCLHKQYDPFYNGNRIHLWSCYEGTPTNKSWIIGK